MESLYPAPLKFKRNNTLGICLCSYLKAFLSGDAVLLDKVFWFCFCFVFLILYLVLLLANETFVRINFRTAQKSSFFTCLMIRLRLCELQGPDIPQSTSGSYSYKAIRSHFLFYRYLLCVKLTSI